MAGPDTSIPMYGRKPFPDRFTKDAELVHDLRLSPNGDWAPITPTPINVAQEPLIVPGQPWIPLSDGASVHSFLMEELATERLDKMRGILWLLSSKNNINPLHHQAIKGRQILITERPDLHLVWYYDQIFIKPIPRCLLNYAFVKKYIFESTSTEIQKSTNGFLRTYARLIAHESDFDIAKEKGLLPKDENITWAKWCKYIEGYRAAFEEEDVADRYIYGELRLTRLNFYSKVFCYEWNYFDTYTQYGLYFSRFMAPYLFVFGSISVVLTAMQTTLAADASASIAYQVSVRRFANFSLWATGIGLLFFPLLYIFFQLRELLFAIIHGHRHRKG